MELTQNYLKECLDYNELTGIFTWKKRPLSHFDSNHRMNNINSRSCNKNAGYITDSGYLTIRINGFLYRAHRLAWLHVYGVMPENQIDHINGVRDDNRIINLRLAVNAENCQNKRVAQSNNKSGFLGVFFNKEKNMFVSKIMVNGKNYNLGKFETPEKAHNAYVLAKRQLHEFGTL